MPNMPAQDIKKNPWPHTVGSVSFWMVNNIIAEDSQGRIYIIHLGACRLAHFDKKGHF